MNTNILSDDIVVTPLLVTLQRAKIEDSVYFGPAYKQYISNSRLGLLNPYRGGTPEKFFNNNISTFTPSLALGSCIHELVLQPELFHLCTSVNKPSAKAGVMADMLYLDFIHTDGNEQELFDIACRYSKEYDYYQSSFNEAKWGALKEKCLPYWMSRREYEQQHLPSEPIYCDEKLREKVLLCLNAIEENKDIQSLLHPLGIFEDPIVMNEEAVTVTLKVENKATGHVGYFPWKSKIDNFTIDTEMNKIIVNDLKTVGRPIPMFDYNFYNFSYYRELFIYSYLLCLIAEREYYMKDFTVEANCLLVSTVPPYDTGIYRISRKEMIYGQAEFKALLGLALAYQIEEGFSLEDLYTNHF